MQVKVKKRILLNFYDWHILNCTIQNNNDLTINLMREYSKRKKLKDYTYSYLHSEIEKLQKYKLLERISFNPARYVIPKHKYEIIKRTTLNMVIFYNDLNGGFYE